MNDKTLDFSDEAIGRTVMRTGWESKLTRYAPACGLGLAATALILGLSWYYFVLAGLFITAGLANSITLIFIFGKKTAARLRQEMLRQMEELSRAEMADLKKKLEDVEQDYAAKQLEEMDDVFHHFKEKLDAKLSGKRGLEEQLAAAEDMRAAALHNLNLIVDYQQDINMLDVADSKKRIKKLKASGNGCSEEIASHEKQIALAEKTEESIAHLIEKIEGAITALKEAAIGLNDIQLGEDAKQDIDRNVGKFRNVAEMNRRVYVEVTEAMKKLR